MAITGQRGGGRWLGHQVFQEEGKWSPAHYFLLLSPFSSTLLHSLLFNSSPLTNLFSSYYYVNKDTTSFPVLFCKQHSNLLSLFVLIWFDLIWFWFDARNCFKIGWRGSCPSSSVGVQNLGGSRGGDCWGREGVENNRLDHGHVRRGTIVIQLHTIIRHWPF